MLESLIKNAGHKCIFLPKFHCELNPIEMVRSNHLYYMFYSSDSSKVLGTGEISLPGGPQAEFRRGEGNRTPLPERMSY
jgi:hypothetical protein